MRYFKKHQIIIIVLFIALIFRLFISQFGDNYDLYANAGWGQQIYQHGSKGFYENRVWIYSWPTQLPLINIINGFNYYIFEQKLLWLFAYIEAVIIHHQIFPQYFNWWFDFVNWFGTDLFKDTPFKNGFMVSMKLIPILSDITIGLIIYLFGEKFNNKRARVISLLFLFIPFSWYVSSLWGQYDQLGTVLVLISFLLLYKKYFVISTALLFLSIQAKPTTIFFSLFYTYYFFYQKPSIKSVLYSILLVIFIFVIVVTPFTDKNPFLYSYQTILPKVFNNDRYGLVNHAFNFWQMLAPQGGWATTFHLFGIIALIWGIIFLIILNFWSVITFRKNGGLKGLVMSIYLIAAGSYLFATGMVDRYFYPAVVFLGILVFYFPKLFKWWILVTFIFSANLFYSWGFPLLTDLTAWKSDLIIRLFSFLNILIFFIILYKINIVKRRGD